MPEWVSLNGVLMPAEEARVSVFDSGFTQGIGYSVACLGPLLFGVFHDVSGGYAAPFGLLVVAVIVVLLGAYQACKPRMLEDSWHAPAKN